MRQRQPARMMITMMVVLMLMTTLLACSGSEGGRKGAMEGGNADSGSVVRGRVISSEKIGEKSLREVEIEFRDNNIRSRPTSGVELYRIVYETVDPHGRKTVASGALALPAGATRALPLMSFQHGTVVNRSTVASEYGFDVASLLFGGAGYVVAIPDYLGLGQSPGLHPYVHAGSLATAVVDMLRAAREFCAERKVGLNGQLFLLGYSEGGYATMAAHKELEERHADEFTVTAAAPMAGPYDMSGTMRDLFLENRPYPDPFYLPYVVLAYQNIYRLTDSLPALFAEPYASTLPDLFNGENEGFVINEKLPRSPITMLNPQFLENFRRDSLNPLRRALRENDLYNWTPRAPMRIYHCTADDRVPFRNAQVAYDSFKRRGVASVELVALNHGGHGACGYPSIYAGKDWFDSLRK